MVWRRFDVLETKKLLEKPPEDYHSNFSPSGKDYIINKYIGREIWEKIKNKKTRYILMIDAIEKFKIDMIAKFGSWYNWQTNWAKRQGFKNYPDYLNSLVKKLGFKTRSKYMEYLVRKRGFENRADYEMHLIESKGLTLKEYLDINAKKAGFKNHSERRKTWPSRKSKKCVHQHS